ncbi:MAG: D-2-hydroxyacid dehydrogenase [Candidatus Nitronauta litoralis]|uniref:D-2-hydroxyacid dehydrogenase n=1 Tax=Candidatus Nitronauta litoralis TaxID=2705533 RepID=A0A7T0FYJ1_9BACT|nr:MAG: D-2-hydroxyacid dehydrogenase [Candidatus Nitronauta litoralis]
MKQQIHIYLTHPHVSCWNFKERHRDLLEQSIPGFKVKTFLNSKDFLSQLPDAGAVIVWFFKKEWLEKASHLKLISTPAAGTDWIALPEPSECNILPEVWHGGFHGSMMAESVLGAAFHFLKGFEFSRKIQGQKKWARKKISDRIESLYKSRIVILGFGRIGQAIGKAFKPFGCQITGIKRSLGNQAPDWFDEKDRLATFDQLPDLLPETDHFVLTLPGGKETDGLLKPSHFEKLNGKVIFYNVGRGNPYRESDLLQALNSKKIQHAYLDVFEPEPLPETSPLWELDNVLIQPHVSAASPQYLDLYLEEFIQRWVKSDK